MDHQRVGDPPQGIRKRNFRQRKDDVGSGHAKKKGENGRITGAALIL